MHGIFSAEGLSALFQVIGIDLVLAGDNAVVIGLAVAGVPAHLRAKAIFIGIIAATVMRIGFALVASELLQIVGLMLAGGLLLLWVSWKMWRELRRAHQGQPAAVATEESLIGRDLDRDGRVAGVPAGQKTFRQALVQIILADLSMSLDNVLAVAGAAREHPAVLAIGLVLSIALMALAASLIARLLARHRWIAYLGLAIIVFVALSMIREGSMEAGAVLAAHLG